VYFAYRDKKVVSVFVSCTYFRLGGSCQEGAAQEGLTSDVSA
jgi:hypothetical protein